LQIGALSKITARTAQEICDGAADALEVTAPPGLAPAAFLEELLSAGRLSDAVPFLAYALPKREAVWWACLSARSALDEGAAAETRAALEAAEAWVYRPTDENRRAAFARAEAAKFNSPSAWAAVGAFWSGGSMAPPDAPAVPPPAHLTGVAVSGAITLAAVMKDPETADEKRLRYIEIAVDIANGGDGRVHERRP